MNLEFLSHTGLFRGIRTDELPALLSCLGAHEKSYKKGEIIYHAGNSVTEIGMVEQGSVNIVVQFTGEAATSSAMSRKERSLPRHMLPFPAKNFSVMLSHQRTARSFF